MDVLLQGEAPLHGDMVVLAIGVTPDTALARSAGLELGIKGSILVNDRMEASVPDIYAVGDAVQVKHFVTGQDLSLIHISYLRSSIRLHPVSPKSSNHTNRRYMIFKAPSALSLIHI